jgi:hypothetical protein
MSPRSEANRRTAASCWIRGVRRWLGEPGAERAAALRGELVDGAGAGLRRLRTRLRLLHQHYSVAVPDELAVEQANTWRAQLGLVTT